VARKAAGQVVVSQVDELDASTCSGWSVTVTGRARLVTDATARYRAVPLVPWDPGRRELFVTVTSSGGAVPAIEPHVAVDVRLKPRTVGRRSRSPRRR
jgi:Pyridoxamine 5'-phosphate oxidase